MPYYNFDASKGAPIPQDKPAILYVNITLVEIMRSHPLGCQRNLKSPVHIGMNNQQLEETFCDLSLRILIVISVPSRCSGNHDLTFVR
jgi:hypothetical protein